jgi:hypothetical protein
LGLMVLIIASPHFTLSPFYRKQKSCIKIITLQK